MELQLILSQDHKGFIQSAVSRYHCVCAYGKAEYHGVEKLLTTGHPQESKGEKGSINPSRTHPQYVASISQPSLVNIPLAPQIPQVDGHTLGPGASLIKNPDLNRRKIMFPTDNQDHLWGF